MPRVYLSCTSCLNLDPFLNSTPKGWKESFAFPDAKFYAESFEKKKKITRPWKFLVWPSAGKLAALTGDLSTTSIGKVLKADQKKSLSATMSKTLFWWSRRFTYFFLFYLSVVIDNVKPAYLDLVNSNI